MAVKLAVLFLWFTGIAWFATSGVSDWRFVAAAALFPAFFVGKPLVCCVEKCWTIKQPEPCRMDTARAVFLAILPFGVMLFDRTEQLVDL